MKFITFILGEVQKVLDLTFEFDASAIVGMIQAWLGKFVKPE